MRPIFGFKLQSDLNFRGKNFVVVSLAMSVLFLNMFFSGPMMNLNWPKIWHLSLVPSILRPQTCPRQELPSATQAGQVVGRTVRKKVRARLWPLTLPGARPKPVGKSWPCSKTRPWARPRTAQFERPHRPARREQRYQAPKIKVAKILWKTAKIVRAIGVNPVCGLWVQQPNNFPTVQWNYAKRRNLMVCGMWKPLGMVAWKFQPSVWMTWLLKTALINSMWWKILRWPGRKNTYCSTPKYLIFTSLTNTNRTYWIVFNHCACLMNEHCLSIIFKCFKPDLWFTSPPGSKGRQSVCQVEFA